jgi:uncharacterized membrane protein YedE/YeeE
MSRLVSILAGLLFGVGLTLSDMVNPQRVLAFLDVAGAWDPSLAIVMASALLPAALAWQVRRRRERPWLADRFHVPVSRKVDRALLAGAALFGVGWGLIGLCPGPALADLAIQPWPTAMFVVALVGGMGLNWVVHALSG